MSTTSCPHDWPRDSQGTKERPIKALPGIFLSLPAEQSSACLLHLQDYCTGTRGSPRQYTSLCKEISVARVNKDKQRQADERRGDKVLEPSTRAISIFSILSQKMPLLCLNWFVLNFVSNNQRSPDKLFLLELTSCTNKKALFLSHKFLQLFTGKVRIENMKYVFILENTILKHQQLLLGVSFKLCETNNE